MGEGGQLRDAFERDLRRIALPPEAEWFPTRPSRRGLPVSLVAAGTVAAIIVALVAGSYLYSRQPEKGGVLVPPASPTSQFVRYEVSGKVTDATTGTALPGIRVYLVVPGAPGMFDTGGTALTDASGSYRMQVLHGNYEVLFVAARSGQANICTRNPPCGADPIATLPYQPLWWPSGTSASDAGRLAVDRDREGIDGALLVGHEIVGRFTYRGQPVRAFIGVQQASGLELVVIGTTNTDGTFRIPVPDGTYRIEFAPHDPGPMGGSASVTIRGADASVERVEP